MKKPMANAKTVTLTLPVKPYLKQFLTASFGEVLPLTNNHLISVFVLVCLEGKRHTGYNVSQQNQVLAAYSEKYTVLLPANKQYLNGIQFTPHNVIYINRLLDNFFDQQLYFHTETNRMRNAGKRYYGYHNCLRNFLEKYKIEEDAHITFDALIKKEQRFRKSVNFSQTFASNIVLSD
jgi:hypothetical protein